MEEKDQQTLMLALYKENCDQARHHEVLRERVTTLLATTAGIVLGLFGFSNSWADPKPVHLAIPAFLVALGVWGFVASWKHNERAKLHVQRTRQVRKRLSSLSGIDLSDINSHAKEEHEKEFGRKASSELRAHIIWKTFPILISSVGIAVLMYLLMKLRIFCA